MLFRSCTRAEGHHHVDRRRAGHLARRRAGEAVTDVTSLPDDVLEVVFGHLARDASPGQYFNAMLTSKRFRDAGMIKRALSDVGEKVLSKATAENWNEGASAFAEAAVDAGSVFATFLVGSVDFYCRDSTLECDEQRAKARRSRGASLLARAAVAGSPDAHHTLAIMHSTVVAASARTRTRRRAPRSAPGGTSSSGPPPPSASSVTACKTGSASSRTFSSVASSSRRLRKRT